MDPFNLPESLEGIDDSELIDLQEQVAEAIAEAKNKSPEEMGDEDIAAIEHIVSARDRLRAEADRREGERVDQVDRATNALAALDEPDDDEIVGQGDEPDGGGDGEPGEPPAEPGEPDAEADDEPVSAVPVPAAAASQPTVRTPAAQGAKPIGREITQGVARRRPAASRPRNQRNNPLMVASAHVTDVPGLRHNSPLKDTKAVALAITEKRRRMRPMPEGTEPEYVAIGIGSKDLSFNLGKDDQQNFMVMEELREKFAGVVDGGFSEQALVASGGCCAPFTPLYDFFRLAVPDSSMEDSLPVVGAPRGGIRFIACTDWRVAVSGIAEYTCTDSTNNVAKPCVHAPCPGVQEASVEAVTQCVLFDNLQYRVFPEMTESFLADLAVAFQERKEAFFRTQFAALSTAVTHATPAYGTSRTLFSTAARASHQYRSRQAMAQDAQLLWYVPSWVRQAAATDIVNDAANGVVVIDRAMALVDDIFGQLNVTPVWYRDLRTAGDGPAGAQGAGILRAWTDDFITWMMAPGTFVKLDGGTLDVGLVRDSALNRTNDLQLFMEEWLGIARVGCESVQITVTQCPTGEAPAGITAVTDCALV